jgi:hypothetical protein
VQRRSGLPDDCERRVVTCIAAGGKTSTVTIDSKDTGSYLVQ